MLNTLATVEPVIREAGEITRRAFGRAIQIPPKARGEIVTETDLEVEKLISTHLREHFPTHGFLGEETGSDQPQSDFVWILDPIDGTAHFDSGVPLYSISLALQHGDELVLGVVYNPESNQFYSACRGQGSRLNGNAITCSTKTDLAESTLMMEIPNRHFDPQIMRNSLANLEVLMPKLDRIKIIGVSALGLCYVAAGGFDVYLNVSTGSKVWDLAAGKLILQESGGIFTSTDDNRHIAGPHILHDAIRDLLNLSTR